SCNAAFCPPHQHHAKVEFNGGHRTHRRGGITQLSAQRSLQSSRVALNTFDFKAPSAPQYVEQPTLARQGDVPQLEVFDGNPAFMYRNAGEGAREARQRMEVLEWQAKLFGGASDCRSLSPGRTFQLTEHHWFDGHDDSDADFLVVSVSIDARNNHADRGNAPVYANSFSCIRRKIPYRPRRQHKKPRMPGPQTATVVGPKGQEIHTDPHGRIKVQFPWDRYGRHDERSSCWIRVSQPWAGAGWGTVAIPRIGQEVVIDYLEGDPDRPLCTGRLYNSAQPLPYALPGAAHVMGFKSRSTPGGGGFCEMVIHDRKGRELINIHSQKDMVTTVQHTQATVVNGPHQTNTVTNGFQVTKVKKRVELESQTEFIHLKVATKIMLEVGASRIEMAANGKITIQGLHVDVIGAQRIDLNTNGAPQAQSSAAPIPVHATGFVPSESASGMMGLMQGLRGETSVMENPSTAKTLGKHIRTGGQIANEMFNPKEIARSAWDAIDSGNPADIAMATAGFLPMGTLGKAPRAAGKVLAGKEVSLVEAGNAEMATSRLSQAGGLKATEGKQVLKADGQLSNPTHPLAKHGPDVSDKYLYNRVAGELALNNRKGLRTAFNDRAQMEDAIAKTFAQKQAEIDAWIGSQPRAGIPKPFEANPQMGNLGRGFEIVNPGGPIVPITRPMPNVNLVLLPDGKGGYLIHTAHPF
uniref:type VI secretion system tip protein TssI/VgrG n=1 Tax=Noviherbaspirillum aerium TaxID=2588497 RepID=UPI00124DC5BE